jgi:glycosyltransferase involved in cell wall biosynthesis
MRIVFFSHYFPPLNSSGARRIIAFAKYLALSGHQITIISTTKSIADGPLTEDIPQYVTLLELNGLGRVSKTKVKPAALRESATRASQRSVAGDILLGFKRAISKYTGQLIDHRILFSLQFTLPWLAGEVKKAIKHSDIVMTTSPPWPIHLAGRIVKARFKKPWIADYRDQFSGSHIQSGTPWFQRREIEIDRWLLKKADYVLTISGPMKEYYDQFHNAVACIENGYDEQMFVDLRLSNPQRSDSNAVIIRYLGKITATRIPLAFFQALVNINRKLGKPVIAEFYGESDLLLKTISQSIPEVTPFIKICKQLPYRESIRAMLTADALFFIETSDFSSHSARGVLTTKLFEYVAARKPIIAEISQATLASQYIKQAGTGLVISEDANEIEKTLENLRKDQVALRMNESFINSLSREFKTAELDALFRLVLQHKSDQAVA